ncbi:MAG: hypothetical protein HW415_570 [Deltaproteobacteria bacterium]|nr:hypothetical protein [Deltaproteobacteria bacterium]
MYKWCKESRGQENLEPGTSLFVWLLAASVFAISSLAFFLWWIPTIGLGNINRTLPFILAVILGGLILSLLLSASLLVLSAAGHDVPFPDKLRGLLIKLFLPAMLFLGGIFRVEKIKIHKAFIEINNRLVKSMAIKARPDSFLILMPHCLQFQDCNFKVTRDIENCGECGRCEIVELLHLGREYGIKLFVNTGGTSARKIVASMRPNAVVAVACERDLVSGVIDSYPLPVVGITNIRPEGYCLNTHVAVEKVKEGVSLFINK